MSTATRPTPAPTIPPLENGDRLSRAEFERRYDAMAGVKAELIEGFVHMPSPVRHSRHSRPNALVVAWLLVYEAATPGVEAGDNGSVRLDLENEPQPDAYLMIHPGRGGQARISEDDYVEGAPELVAEVASSSVSIDLGPKLDAYRRNGVREYLVWRALDGALDWLVLREERFEPLAPDADGLWKSTTFPGLWLDGRALLSLDSANMLAALNRGLATPEHAAFVERLKDASA
ncbi:Uma2 family endonuclease [Paludisphaera mucosa]|uniref:Uma2 family endonuclease n=1 Tax=Paludisphaera mucosa TaxID=3030827 RepID=A0ABT6FHR4_9BACT|nr:Uma2 family endonuclease [Paludisphaera mucosa]MDG3007084.1 Uma2 family endonuclease [Paludisphaera mucosa]